MKSDEIARIMPSPEHVIVFAGAGISSGAGLPLFNDLRRDLFANVLNPWWLSDKTKAKLENGLNDLAPEYAISLLDNDGDGPRRHICQCLSTGKPAFEHGLLAFSIARGVRVYTSNFDTLIEAAAEFNITVAARSGGDDPVDDADLYKLHGSCPDILVDAEDVLLSVTESWAKRFVADCAIPNTHVLIWGYQGRDPDLAPLVLQGIKAAERCTWIAYSDSDQTKAIDLLNGMDHAIVVPAHSNGAESHRIARSILDPDGDFNWTPTGAVPYTATPYAIRHPETRAHALSHLGNERQGRVAWLSVAGSRKSASLKPLVRSLLFDSRPIQTAAVSVLRPLFHLRPGPQLGEALLTAAEGRSVRESSDRLIRQVCEDLDSGNLKNDKHIWSIRARIATLQRQRGLLNDAVAMLDKAMPADELSATWRGRLTYERCITYRLQGRYQEAFDLLNSIDTNSPSIVGANWAMWLEDEQCALAIQHGDTDAASRHLARAKQLAKAYGEHRLATVDLAIRTLQLDILEGNVSTTTVNECERLARRMSVLTPLRQAWVHGAGADAARQRGDWQEANRLHLRLAKSPHLLHRLAACVGLMLCNGPSVDTNSSELSKRTGPTSTYRLLETFAPTFSAASNDTIAWRSELEGGSGFLFLS